MLVKKSFKDLFKVRNSDKFVAKTTLCLLKCFSENFESLITQIGKLWHWNTYEKHFFTCDTEKLRKQTVNGIYMNTFSFYLENNRYIKVLLRWFY